MGEPNLVTQSGREDLSVADRIGMLRQDLLLKPLNGITSDTPAATQDIHDMKVTIGWIRGAITMYERAIARGETEEGLRKGANRILSEVECCVLAWRRGGHREFERVLASQRARSCCDG